MADGKYKKPCLDSSVFIGGIGDGEIVGGIKRGVIFRSILDRADAGDFKIYISALAIAEVYKKKRAAKPAMKTLDGFLECLNGRSIEVIEIDREVGLKAHSLCRRYHAEKLSPNDAIHLACALRAGCDVLLAWDTPLVSIKADDIIIRQPEILGPTLFTESEIATTEEIEEYRKRKDRERLEESKQKRAAIREANHAAGDEFADTIAALPLPAQFTTKDVRVHLNGHQEAYRLQTIISDYCHDGKMVMLGRKARFQKVARGRYMLLS